MAGKYDDMSFKSAFAAAMKDKGEGKNFSWRGKSYKLAYAGKTKSDRAAPDTSTTKPKARSRTAVGKSPRPYTRSDKAGAETTRANLRAKEAVRAGVAFRKRPK